MSQLIFRGRVKAANGRGFWQANVWYISHCVLVASFNAEGRQADALQVLHTLRWREAFCYIQTLRLKTSCIVRTCKNLELTGKTTWGEQVNCRLCIFQPQEWSAACTKGGNYGSFPLVACKVLCFYIIKPQNIMIAASISVQLIHPMPISSAVHQLSTQSEDFQLIFQNIFSLLHLL